MSQQTTNRYFDELARAVAEGSLSRRRALKLFAGTAIAALIPSRALAEEECVRICHVPKTATGDCDFANARTRCVSRRERRRHLDEHRPCDCRGSCRNCLTPECPVGREPLRNGTCAVPCTTLADCVPPGGTISNCDACSAEADTGDGFCAGAPQGPCEGTLDCPEGQFCVAGTCVSRCNPEI